MDETTAAVARHRAPDEFPTFSGQFDVYDIRRAFVVEEYRRQHIVVESMRRDLAFLNREHRSNPMRTPLHKVELASGLLHDEQAVESYLKRTLAAYPLRQRAEMA